MPEQSSPTGAVFLSYASEDAEAAARICEALRAAGVEVWFDRNELRGGDTWDSQIKKQIHDCTLFMPLISAQTNARIEGYFRGEWNLATRRLVNRAHDAAFLMPVVIDETREADARVPEEFLRTQWTWLPGGETPPAFARRVRQLLGLEPAFGATTKATATGVVEPSNRGPGSVRPRGLSRARLIGVALLALLLVLGGGLFWYYQGASDAPAAKPVPATTLPVTAVAPNDKSIAVLPFVDMSADKNQEYMADGITEELLNLLAQAPDLKVIARTSSFAFKGQNLEIAEIAKKLNVAHVLEGSVRTSGNQMRITAQLVRAADSTHLWSEKYDRPLDDIFAVQDEIANAIVQALQIKLQGGTLTRREGGTDNLEAYRHYLRAWSEFNQNTRSSLDVAEASLKKALDIDPKYGMAWDFLGSVSAARADNGFIPATEGYKRAREFTLRALELSPNLAGAHASLGSIYMAFDWNWSAAEVQFNKAFAIDPSDLLALNEAGRLANALGQWEKSERLFRAALARDPLDPFVTWNLGHTRYLAGHLAEAEDIFRQLLSISPSFGWTRPFLGKTLLLRGKPEEALRYIEQEPDEINRLLYLPVVLHALGRREESDEAIRAQISVFGDTAAVYVAQNYAYRGDKDRAMEWLERAYRQKDPGLIEIVGEPLLKGMADDPRYKAFLRKMNLPV